MALQMVWNMLLQNAADIIAPTNKVEAMIDANFKNTLNETHSPQVEQHINAIHQQVGNHVEPLMRDTQNALMRIEADPDLMDSIKQYEGHFQEALGTAAEPVRETVMEHVQNIKEFTHGIVNGQAVNMQDIADKFAPELADLKNDLAPYAPQIQEAVRATAGEAQGILERPDFQQAVQPVIDRLSSLKDAVEPHMQAIAQETDGFTHEMHWEDARDMWHQKVADWQADHQPEFATHGSSHDHDGGGGGHSNAASGDTGFGEHENGGHQFDSNWNTQQHAHGPDGHSHAHGNPSHTHQHWDGHHEDGGASLNRATQGEGGQQGGNPDADASNGQAGSGDTGFGDHDNGGHQFDSNWNTQQHAHGPDGHSHAHGNPPHTHQHWDGHHEDGSASVNRATQEGGGQQGGDHFQRDNGLRDHHNDHNNRHWEDNDNEVGKGHGHDLDSEIDRSDMDLNHDGNLTNPEVRGWWNQHGQPTVIDERMDYNHDNFVSGNEFAHFKGGQWQNFSQGQQLSHQMAQNQWQMQQQGFNSSLASQQQAFMQQQAAVRAWGQANGADMEEIGRQQAQQLAVVQQQWAASSHQFTSQLQGQQAAHFNQSATQSAQMQAYVKDGFNDFNNGNVAHIDADSGVVDGIHGPHISVDMMDAPGAMAV